MRQVLFAKKIKLLKSTNGCAQKTSTRNGTLLLGNIYVEIHFQIRVQFGSNLLWDTRKLFKQKALLAEKPLCDEKKRVQYEPSGRLVGM
jgi:hypothetical protein